MEQTHSLATTALVRYRDNMSDGRLHVVSVANEKTLPVWRYGHKAVVSQISAHKYTVIVPRESVRAFSRVTDSRITVEDEEHFLSEIRPVLEQRLPRTNPRFGWYLQQFIKLSAIERFSKSENVVLWDADTIPLRALSFFSSEGNPRYYAGTEYHHPYFEFIEKCLGFSKKVEPSFVAQCFPIVASHGQAFFSALAARSDRPWWEFLADNIDFGQGAGFSEYETVGTYIAHAFPDSVEWQSRGWKRNGWEIFKSPRRATASVGKPVQAHEFDYCSFERWQRPRIIKSLLAGSR